MRDRPGRRLLRARRPLAAGHPARRPRAARPSAVELPLRAVFEAPTVSALASRGSSRGLEPAAARTLRAGRRGRARPPPLVRRPAGEPAPLSFGQERLWFLDRLEPGNTAFNMGSSLRLGGRLDARALERALNEIVRRHEALRATFVEIEGRPVQRTLPNLRVPLAVVDLSALPEAAREAEAERVARASLASPFDLASGPLVRTSLLRLAPDRPRLRAGHPSHRLGRLVGGGDGPRADRPLRRLHCRAALAAAAAAHPVRRLRPLAARSG